MNKDKFNKLINKNFKCLIEEYNFSIIHTEGPHSFGNYLSVLESKDYRLRILTERGQVFIDVGLKNVPFNYIDNPRFNPNYYTQSKWHDVFHILLFQNQNKEQSEFNYDSPDLSIEDEKLFDMQMSKLSDKLSEYWAQIFSFLSQEHYDQNKKQLDHFLRKKREKTKNELPLG